MSVLVGIFYFVDQIKSFFNNVKDEPIDVVEITMADMIMPEVFVTALESKYSVKKIKCTESNAYDMLTQLYKLIKDIEQSVDFNILQINYSIIELTPQQFFSYDNNIINPVETVEKFVTFYKHFNYLWDNPSKWFVTKKFQLTNYKKALDEILESLHRFEKGEQ